MKVIEGNFNHTSGKYAIVVSRWNAFITERLLEGALDTLKRHGVPEEQITVVYCPGSYEIPLTAQKLLQSEKFDAIICLGAVIKGGTPHFDYVCSAVNKGLADLNLKFGKPVLFGVITTNSIEQAIERAGTKAGNKGVEAASSALEMVSLAENLKSLN